MAETSKVLYTVDATYVDGAVVHDIDELTSVTTAAVASGGGHVLDESHVVFPNGAVTLVLILAESHLSIHTWPEESRVAVDLFSCGAIDGALVLDTLVKALHLEDQVVREIPRD